MIGEDKQISNKRIKDFFGIQNIDRFDLEESNLQIAIDKLSDIGCKLSVDSSYEYKAHVFCTNMKDKPDKFKIDTIGSTGETETEAKFNAISAFIYTLQREDLW